MSEGGRYVTAVGFVFGHFKDDLAHTADNSAAGGWIARGEGFFRNHGTYDSLWTALLWPATKGFNVPVSELSRRFGDAVRSRRLKAGLSQEALAERAGLHPTYVSMVERGVRNATLEVAGRLADALKVSLVEIIAETTGSPGRGRRR